MRRFGIARNDLVGLGWLLVATASCAPDVGAGSPGSSGGATVTGQSGGQTSGGGGVGFAGANGAGTAGVGGLAQVSGGFGGTLGVSGAGPGGATMGSGGGGLPGSGGFGGVASGVGGITALGGATGQCNQQLVDPTSLPGCTTCSGGRCVATVDFPGAPLALLDACGTGNVCMPDVIVATRGDVQLAQCTSVSGAEGRCASLCIPVVRSLSTVLPQSTCGADDRCAPCYNPSDGAPTGICNVGCDPGPTAAPVTFPQCCTGRGRCVERAMIPGAAAKSLPQETCASAADVCVPSAVIKDPTYKFPSCTVAVGLTPNAPGVCVPDCIVNAVQYGNLIGQGTCAASGDKCAPCTNPIDGSATGACP